MIRRKRRSDRSGRMPLFSPGRPPAAGRDERRRFWGAIAAGIASEDAAVEVGISQAVGTRWFRKAGGMPPAMFGLSAKPLSGRYLSFAEREEIALLRAQGHSMQEVARRIGRTASTISCDMGQSFTRFERWISAYGMETTPVSAATVISESEAPSSSPVKLLRPSCWNRD